MVNCAPITKHTGGKERKQGLRAKGKEKRFGRWTVALIRLHGAAKRKKMCEKTSEELNERGRRLYKALR